jgi:hypothetical protein
MYVELQDRSIRVRWRPPPAGAGDVPLRITFVDLGMSPLCVSYVPEERLRAMEPSPYKQDSSSPGPIFRSSIPRCARRIGPATSRYCRGTSRRIVEQLAYAREWGRRFVIPIPEVQVL